MDRDLHKEANGLVMYICQQEDPFSELNKNMPEPPLRALCEEFSYLFKEVLGLPPKRTADHQIQLLPDSEPLNQRPYRHPWEQKNVIEQMIKDMLESELIRNSCSSYASPVILVKKADKTWRLC